jgi:hypothetical protein
MQQKLPKKESFFCCFVRFLESNYKSDSCFKFHINLRGKGKFSKQKILHLPKKIKKLKKKVHLLR